MDSDFIKSVELIAEFDSYEDFKSSKYSEYPSISVSKLKMLKRSPLHYKEMEYATSDAFDFGNAYHCFLLQPEKFEEKYYILDDREKVAELSKEYKNPRNTKLYELWYLEECKRAVGRDIISSKDFEIMKDMKRQIQSHFYARTLIKRGVAERFLFVKMTDKYGNVYYIKLIADYIKHNKRLIVDLKTCANASEDNFVKDAAKYNYHLQASLYADILSHLHDNGKRSWSFVFMAQEKSKPYGFNMFNASHQFISQGRYEYELLLLLWKKCLEEDKYPSYQVWCENKFGMLEISLPAYTIKDISYFTNN